MGISQEYEKSYKHNFMDDYAREFRRDVCLKSMEKNPHKTILEIGIGIEPLFAYFDDYERMVCVEPMQTFIDNANCLRKKMQVEEKVICIQGYFEEKLDELLELGYHFDYILASGLIVHIDDLEDFLEKIKCLCNSETVFFVTVPNAYSIHRILAKEMGMIADVHELSQVAKDLQINRVWDLDSLCEYMIKRGFEVIERGSYFPQFLSSGQMERMVREGIASEEIFKGLYKMSKYFPEIGSEIYVQLKPVIL